jgi:hypothetical protein
LAIDRKNGLEDHEGSLVEFDASDERVTLCPRGAPDSECVLHWRQPELTAMEMSGADLDRLAVVR